MMSALSRERVVDKLFEAYFDWCETCARVNDAYRFWARETGPRGSVAFAAYTAALDAEELAAAVYAGLVRRAEELPGARTLPRNDPASSDAELPGHDSWADTVTPAERPIVRSSRAAWSRDDRRTVSDWPRILVCDADS